MPTSDLLPFLLSKNNENQLVLEAVVMELSNWVERQGDTEISGKTRGALDTINPSEAVIKLILAV